MGHHRAPVGTLDWTKSVRVKNRNSFVAGLVMIILYCLAYMSGRPFLMKYRGAILAASLTLALFFFLDAFLTFPLRKDKDADS
jgi:hypothetical protein